MRRARTYSARSRAIETISRSDVWSRSLAAVKALRAMPDAERRFLMAGAKSSWVETLVEWSDLVARAEQTPDDFAPPDRHRPTRREISDALVAGEWFAKLAIMPENVDEFERCREEYRAGRSKSAKVADQKIVEWWAMGWSLKAIGEHRGIRLNEQQVERRIDEIATSLWRIANGWARLADPDERQRARKRHETRHVGG